jgi:hypothetical protein
VNPNSAPTSTHVVHILAAAGSLLVLIGSKRQAQDSLREFRAEFQRLKDELGDRINQLRGVAIEIARRFSQVMSDEILQTTYVSVQLVILIGFLYPILRDRRRARRQLPEDPELRKAQLSMNSLLRTTLNWTYIMLGAIVVFIGATIDLITSWLADLSSRTFRWRQGRSDPGDGSSTLICRGQGRALRARQGLWPCRAVSREP